MVQAWKDWMLPEWIVLVWGWSKEIGLIDLAKKILKLPAFIWMPVEKDVLFETSISDPVFAWVIWNMILANKFLVPNSKFSLNVWGIFASIIKILKKMLP